MRLNALMILFGITFLSFGEIELTDEPATAESVIREAITAMGGDLYLRSVKSMYVEMAAQMEGRDVTWVIKDMVPNKSSFQIISEGQVVHEEWFNGQLGFEASKGQKMQRPAYKVADKLPRKNIFNELDYLDTTLYKLELMGEATTGTSACFKIKAVFVDGSTFYLFYDKANHHLVKFDRVSKINPGSVFSTFYSDYKKFGKHVFYGTVQYGEGIHAEIAQVKKVSVNEGVAETDFDR